MSMNLSKFFREFLIVAWEGCIFIVIEPFLATISLYNQVTFWNKSSSLNPPYLRIKSIDETKGVDMMTRLSVSE
jgi:hypothetical protein